MQRKIIVNADDFGLCDGVNNAIYQACTEGVLTSTTLMANMPAAVQAAEIAKKMPKLGVGVHLNALEGKPLSEQAAKILTRKTGEFKYSAGKLAVMAMVSGAVRRAIEVEFEAQISWVIGKGIVPSHLDSHKHIHCLPAIWRIVCNLAAKFNIPAVRWPYEPATVCGGDWPAVGAGDKFRAMLLRQMASKCQSIDERFIKTDIFFGLAHTGKIDKNFWNELSQTQFAGVAEVMTHPGYTDGLTGTRLVEQRVTELKWLCADSTKKVLADAEIELITYRDIDKE